ncbi:MAG: DUF1573 domain-containing protein [Bacteroidetes bacterium]|nr:DUF1573 domain-containing protein [Bacteroidota bacterium]
MKISKIMKTISLLLSIIALSIVVNAQKTTTIEFEKLTHDYGTIHEEKGPVSYDFIFHNTGKEKYIITKVDASCGCTTPAYSEEPVKAGKIGFVRATYDPANLRGKFSKTITVIGNSNSKIVLTIEGNVIPRPRSELDDYPALMGGLRFKVNHVVLGEVFENEIDTGLIEVYNFGKTDITISSMRLPDCLRTEYTPIVLKAGEKRKIEVYFSAYIKEDLGYVFERMQLQTDDPLMPEKELIVVANIIKNIKILSEEELKNTGSIQFDKKEVDFKKIKHGDVKFTEFKFMNTGTDQLVIYDTKTDCGCTATTLGKMRYEPGEEGLIKVTFNSKGKNGSVQQSITVTTNDPNNPEVFLLLRANVESIN